MSHRTLSEAVAQDFALVGSDSGIEPDAEVVNFIPAHDQLPVEVDVKEPRPWHRSAAVLMVRGEGLIEVARSLQVSLDHVRALKSQEWFQVFIRDLQRELRAGPEGLMKSLAYDALFKLHSIAVSSDVPPGVARQACSDLLDRCPDFVKVKEKEKKNEDLPDDPVQALRQLQQEEAALTEQLAGLPDTSV